MVIAVSLGFDQDLNVSQALIDWLDFAMDPMANAIAGIVYQRCL